MHTRQAPCSRRRPRPPSCGALANLSAPWALAQPVINVRSSSFAHHAAHHRLLPGQPRGRASVLTPPLELAGLWRVRWPATWRCMAGPIRSPPCPDWCELPLLAHLAYLCAPSRAMASSPGQRGGCRSWSTARWPRSCRGGCGLVCCRGCVCRCCLTLHACGVDGGAGGDGRLGDRDTPRRQVGPGWHDGGAVPWTRAAGDQPASPRRCRYCRGCGSLLSYWLAQWCIASWLEA